eukprot:2054554-Pyramimonas_sp.AAC.1
MCARAFARFALRCATQNSRRRARARVLRGNEAVGAAGHRTSHASRDPRGTALPASDGARRTQEIKTAPPSQI